MPLEKVPVKSIIETMGDHWGTFDGKTSFSTTSNGLTPSQPAPSSQQYESFKIPSTQNAIITPQMGKVLNLQSSVIAVRDPLPGEALVQILYTGICRSVCISLSRWTGLNQHAKTAQQTYKTRMIADNSVRPEGCLVLYGPAPGVPRTQPHCRP